jgi:hypothetical protein
MSNTKTKFLSFGICALSLFWILCFGICHSGLTQGSDLELTIDLDAKTEPLPKVFRPNIDLSGRGFHHDVTWPQNMAAKEVLEAWHKDIGFNGVFRMQYNLWEISQLAKDPESQNKLLNSYYNIMKDITDAGGIIILDIFGTPAGLGEVLDKKNPPRDLRAFKVLIKNAIRELSCIRRYNIWYEVWTAPDLEDFFLGRKQEYFNLYRAVAEAAVELKNETKVYIPVGGPSTSWWFQNFDNNTIAMPERSLIYELIKYCYRYRLPLDFISWHGFSTDSQAEKESSIYKKTAISLIRDWLSYFNLDINTPLIVDEWNYDRGTNVSLEREKNSHICASYIPSRIKDMYEAGLNYQLYFSLEDFYCEKEQVIRNVGIFSFEPHGNSQYKGSPKATYNIFKMLTQLGDNLFSSKLEDEFAGVIATKTGDGIVLVIYNYIDPEIGINYLSKNIANLNNAERKKILRIIQSRKLEQVLQHQLDISKLRLAHKLKALVKKALELSDLAKTYEQNNRNIKLIIKNLKENYLYQRYTIDSSCSSNCDFAPVEEKETGSAMLYQETLALKPYSVHMIVLKKKPPEPTRAETAESVSDEAAVEPVVPQMEKNAKSIPGEKE